jgi:hypothetical protein
MDILIDIGEETAFKSVTASFLLDQKHWIFIPEVVNFYLSEDGIRFQKVAAIDHNIPLDSDDPLINDFSFTLDRRFRIKYLRIEAVNIGACPDWHPGKGQKAWIFADEIKVE